MRRLVFAVCVLALLSAGCGEQQLGRRVVECDGPSQALGTSIILTAQAVPGTEYIPCVDALRPGWQFEHVQARSGQAYFTLDSDRMGMEFLRVTLLPSCDIGAATEVRSDEREVTLSVEVLEETAEFTVVVIPVADRHHDYAAWVGARFMSEEVNGREIVANLDESDQPISEKIASAHSAGNPVVIIDDAEVDTETVSLRRVATMRTQDSTSMQHSQRLATMSTTRSMRPVGSTHSRVGAFGTTSMPKARAHSP